MMDKPLVRDSADEKQVKEATARKKLQDDQDDKDLKFLLNTPQGLRVLWGLIAKCGIYEPSFTGGSETFYKEGKRAIGLELRKEILACDPDAYIKMINILNKKKDS